MVMRLHQIGALSVSSITSDSVNPEAKVTVNVNTSLRNPRVPAQKLGLEINLPSMRCGIRSDLSTACQTEAPAVAERKYRGGSGGGKVGSGVPVYVMLPLDSVTVANGVNRRKAMTACFQALKSAGVEGVMMDVWWGLVERETAGEYNWGGYSELLEMAKRYGLKVQAVMSFHQCGGNVGDSCTIPLPKWVVEEINKDPDLAYTDQWGRRNYEYLSLGCDTIPCLKGRTPIQCYSDYMRAFRHEFAHLLGDTIVGCHSLRLSRVPRFLSDTCPISPATALPFSDTSSPASPFSDLPCHRPPLPPPLPPSPFSPATAASLLSALPCHLRLPLLRTPLLPPPPSSPPYPAASASPFPAPPCHRRLPPLRPPLPAPPPSSPLPLTTTANGSPDQFLNWSVAAPASLVRPPPWSAGPPLVRLR
ncbi:hypothetical protein SSX86_023278 [Deinandra increscens subsp. villosa]|uniref:Beta-amylase n=1 Tax=Deinandra increscens subsp. villosa TaxID=3103831 RepID=A0AAP0CKJ1_9ASTR